MGKGEGLEGGIPVEVDDEDEVDVVGHDHAVAGHQGRVVGVLGLEKVQHGFAGREEFGVGPVVAAAVELGGTPSFAEAGENGEPLLHAEGEEEELPPMALEVHSHGRTGSSAAGVGNSYRGWRRAGSRAWLRRRARRTPPFLSWSRTMGRWESM